MMKSFGENLLHLMKEKRMSVRDLADYLQISSKTVQEWVGPEGRTPRDLNLIKHLSRVLNCSVYYLLYGEDDPSSGLGILVDKLELHTGLYEITIKKIQK